MTLSMVNINNLSKYVLQELKDGKIDKNTAINIVKQLNEKDDIAIIGMALKNDTIEDYESYWDMFIEKKTNVRRCYKKRFDLVKSLMPKNMDVSKYSKGSYIEDIDMFDNEFFSFTKDEADYLSPGLRKSLEVVYRALEDAGYLGERLNDNKMGFYIGNNFVKDTMFSYLSLCTKNAAPFDVFEMMLFNWTSGLATRVSNYFNFKGPSNIVDGSCASSTIAIYNACNALKHNICTTAVAGGMLIDMAPIKSDSRQSWTFFHPDDVISKLYDNKPGGAYFAEGIAYLVLKPLNKAIEDGDRIHGIISGWAQNCNGSNGAYTQSSAEDIKKVVIESIKSSKVDVNNIRLVMGEGYPHKLEEGIEVSGLIDGFSSFTDKKQFCGLCSIASNMGYMQSSIGVFNTILATMALKKKALPPIHHFINPTDAINLCNSPFFVSDYEQYWDIEEGKERCSAVHSYGYGGINLLLVLREAEEQKQAVKSKGKELFILTAKSKYSMEQNIAAYIDYLSENKDCNLTALCGNASSRRFIFNEYRLAIVADSTEDLLEKLQEAAGSLKTSDGVFYRELDDQKSDKKKKTRYESVKNKTLEEIAKDFCEGKNFAFSELYADCDLTYTKLPGYVFDSKSCWCCKEKEETFFTKLLGNKSEYNMK